MTRDRAITLLVAHALAEGRPVAPLLRLDRLRAAGAARVEAGDLEAGLLRAELPADQARLAATWPAALLPWVRRLGRLPTAATLDAPLRGLRAYLAMVGAVQWIAAFLLVYKVAYAFDLRWIEAHEDALVEGLAVLQLLLYGLLQAATRAARGPTGRWGRWRETARLAARSAALVESGAPPSVIRALPGPSAAALVALGFGASTWTNEARAGHRVASWDAVVDRALAELHREHARFVRAARLLTLTALALLGVVVLAATYATLPALEAPL